ncbi:hypothetical protein AGMMS49992_32360 [Clostridia bacterium]|nr:hypothetical protein AGMMS49992_32360 [Clostridia bacterium]
MGIAAALSSVGLNAEAGGSAFSRVILEIDKAAAAGEKDMKDFADVAGMSAKEFINLWNTDSTAGIQKFVEGLSKVQEQGGNLAGTIEGMGFNEIRVRDTLMRAAGGYDTFARAIQTANEAFKDNIALQNEFDKANGTTAADMKRFANAMNEVGIAAGEVLLPKISGMAEGLAGALKGFSELSSGTQNAILTFAGIAAAIGPVTSAIGGLVTTIGTIGGALSGLAAAGVLGPLAAIGLAAAGVWAVATKGARDYDAAIVL